MIKLYKDGACKECPFMELEIIDVVLYAGAKKVNQKKTVICKFEEVCDREKEVHNEHV